ncbi:tryptophan 2,3-dioxygenase family protein [Streptomyces niveus]|uniref:tryptophan 2,3-dioxygenase family protein n=1 Tax=Streptomyces niveus TaxID=193462 RepID=UPI00342A0A8A
MAIAPPPIPPASSANTDMATTYADHLRLPTLLDASRADADEPHTALFMSVHQICELAFAAIQRRLVDAGAALAECDGQTAVEMVHPLSSLMQTVVDQFKTLRKMSPAAFATVRDEVGTASGIQSAQWRRIEFTCGLRVRDDIETPGFTEQERAGLQHQLSLPSLNEQFAEFAAESGAEENFRWAKAIRTDLLEFDAIVTRWRRAHVGIAHEFIGGEPGTAGTSGEEYLRSRADGRLFPGLDLPSHATDAPGAKR